MFKLFNARHTLYIFLTLTYSLALNVVLITTRGRSSSINESEGTPWFTTALAGLIGVMVIQQIFTNLSSIHINRETFSILLPTVLLWLYMVFLNLQSEGAISKQAMLFPLVFSTTIILKNLDLINTLKLFLVAILIITTIMILLLPETAYYNQPGVVVDKGLYLSSVLAGPFYHPNSLGTVLLLLSPLTLKFPSILRNSLLVSIFVLLLLTQSRTSITIFILWSILLFSTRKRKFLKRNLWFATVVAFFILLLLPFVTKDPTLLTGRGNIWIQTRNAFFENPIWGYGENSYAFSGVLQSSLGLDVVTSHNLGLDLLIRYGILGAFLYFTPIYLSFVRVYKDRKFDEFRASLIFVFIASGISENHLTFFTLGDISGILWFVLILIHSRSENSKQVKC